MAKKDIPAEPLRVKIACPQEAVELDYAALKHAARTVLAGEGVASALISLAFVDNVTIHRLNKKFLDHDEPTDVLSFPMSQPGAKTLEGELVIGAEVARDEAAERGHAVSVELTLYVVHGLLHLCGFDDTDDSSAREMRQRERHYLKLLGLPDVAES